MAEFSESLLGEPQAPTSLADGNAEGLGENSVPGRVHRHIIGDC